ncbi:MAG: RloB family protein [Candidatus Eremiobacterota bacterium]
MSRKQKKKIYREEQDLIEIKTRILIVCEGTKTEPNYFIKFQDVLDDMRIEVKIAGTGYNTESLIEYARILKENGNYNQVWCVFDRDSFTEESIRKAFSQARKYKFRIAFSNEAFELWYLLHFNYYHSAITRNDYIKKLDKEFKKTFPEMKLRYRKNMSDIFDILKDKQQHAINHADRILKSYGSNYRPEKSNPSTTVHFLVKELNNYRKDL